MIQAWDFSKSCSSQVRLVSLEFFVVLLNLQVPHALAGPYLSHCFHRLESESVYDMKTRFEDSLNPWQCILSWNAFFFKEYAKEP